METRPRSRLQFSIKGLLVTILAVASFFGGRASMQPWLENAEWRAKKEEQRMKKERDLKESAQASIRKMQEEINYLKQQLGIPETARIRIPGRVGKDDE
ncbi:MAG TPA: hypothetical protein VMV10_25660 [Pirellulales bacterium]|nr:hypothetical protein [Pirellulales bacterium]